MVVIRKKMDNRAEEEEEQESALGADNGASAAAPPAINNTGDIVVGLEKIPRCSMQNLTVIMTRSVENAFYRLVGPSEFHTQEIEAFYRVRPRNASQEMENWLHRLAWPILPIIPFPVGILRSHPVCTTI